MAFLVLAHVDTCHHVLVIEKELGQSFGQFRLADAGRSHEKERAYRPLFILKAGS